MIPSCDANTLFNPDISGIGVRVSFYLQTLFLGLLSARSGRIEEITASLYALMATNVAMTIAGFIVGFKDPIPEISLQDAITMIYLLLMSWAVVIFSLPACYHLSDDTTMLQLMSVIQSYLVLGFYGSVLATAPGFGSNPDCNEDARIVIFSPIAALHAGRILGWIIFAAVFSVYTVLTIRDYTTKLRRFIRMRKDKTAPSLCASPSNERPQDDDAANANRTTFTAKSDDTKPEIKTTPTRKMTLEAAGEPRLFISWTLIIHLIIIFPVWASFVAHTESTIHVNGLGERAAASWGFGQILALMLTVVPFINMVQAFSNFGLRPTRQIVDPHARKTVIGSEPILPVPG